MTGGTQGNLNTSFQRVLMHSYSAGPSQTSFSSVVIAPSNPKVVYASIRGSANPNDRFEHGELYRSADGGETFLRIAGRIPVFNVLLVDPHRDDRVIVGSDDGIYISTDGGNSFSRAGSSRNVAGLDTIDGEIVLAATSEGILRSSDGGNSWTVHKQGLPSTTALSPNPPKDTDGRREDSGRVGEGATGEMAGLHWGRLEVGGRSSVAA